MAISRQLVFIGTSLRLPRHPFGVPRNDKPGGRPYSVIARPERPWQSQGSMLPETDGWFANRFPKIAASDFVLLAMTAEIRTTL